MMYDNTKVSVELRDIVESGVNIFDFEYQYNGLDKKAFEQKFIDHYYFRQIGQETVGRFKHCIKSKLIEIMPYYNQLFDSEKLMAEQGDPFQAYDLTETFTRNVSNNDRTVDTTNSNATTTNTNTVERTETVDGETNTIEKNLDTPQGAVGNLDDGFLTKASKVDGTTDTVTDTNETVTGETSTSGSANGETTRDGTTQETYTMTRKGNIGVQPFGQEIQYLRNSFLNIDLMIINEFNNLFLLVY